MSAALRVGWLECFAGISGDMLLGALVDAGVSAELLQNTAAALGIGAEMQAHSVVRSGIRATRVDVLEQGRLAEEADHTREHSHEKQDHHGEHRHTHVHGRHWPEIRALIDGAAIPAEAKAIAQRAFALLAEAEAKIHGIAPEKVHFHEVGAVDAIVDIVCGAVGAASLGVEQWRASAVNVGSGFVNCAHGKYPVPAPATAELLRGVPAYAAGPAMELTTPTGAAMLRALGCVFEERTPLTVTSIGYGAGSRDPERFANVLRLSVGVLAARAEAKKFPQDRVVVLECALDDATPQVLAHAMELTLEHGALDAMAAPVTMKKGRLGTLLTLLCRPGDEGALEQLLFRETTTLGIRRREEERVILERTFVTVETAYGKIRMKIASAGAEILNAMPEYEDCRRAAREHDVPLRAVMDAARAVWAESASKAEA
ncbi:MAG TPA: nickel pincer cofactor biosynthesis protein LarC [Acidobacteriaceae bacterium]|nr:nickel pincer cofactor biosynthesis protein LarC [Acidobacteriaceae bacterium]